MADFRTRIVDLGAGVSRDRAQNASTHLVSHRSVPTVAIEDRFADAWPTLRDLLTTFTAPGIIMVAVDARTRTVAGSLCLAAKVGSANAAVIGRHSGCDLYLDGDDTLSLRHLAVVLAPLTDGSNAVTLRVLDLRTPIGFADESGRRLESVSADGSVIVTVGPYTFFFIVSGDGLPWFESAGTDAWFHLPERVYTDDDNAPAPRARRRLAAGTHVESDAASWKSRITHVRASRGPEHSQLLIGGADERALGTLTIRSSLGSQHLVIEERAASGGVLIGRYDRCAGGDVLALHAISRTHVLILLIAGAAYAIDTGSTNGTLIDGNPVRIVRLDDHRDLQLGEHMASLEWAPAAP